jgi:hypothetical protein
LNLEIKGKIIILENIEYVDKGVDVEIKETFRR